MFIFSKLSPVARTTVIYVTVGALTVVWSVIWLLYLRNNLPSSDATYYWAYGFLLTGLTVMLVGLAVGWLGRARRFAGHVELPPEEMSLAAMQAEKSAAVNNARLTAVLDPSATPVVMSNDRNGSSATPIYQLPLSENQA